MSSVLSQDQDPNRMLIEVIEDFSTKDDPAKVVEEIGKGRVSFFDKRRTLVLRTTSTPVSRVLSAN